MNNFEHVNRAMEVGDEYLYILHELWFVKWTLIKIATEQTVNTLTDKWKIHEMYVIHKICM
jgi:hypothetical protein